jgi:hypothetical protein
MTLLNPLCPSLKVDGIRGGHAVDALKGDVLALNKLAVAMRTRRWR